MSWGATAYTPIITYNSPPFGFHEVINPPDFKVCNENPWLSGERVVREIQTALKDAQAKRDVHGSLKDYEYGYDEDFKKLALQDARECQLRGEGIIENFEVVTNLFSMKNILILLAVYFAYKYIKN